MNKKVLYILIGLAGLLLGTVSAFIPLELFIALAGGIVFVVFLLKDYQRVTYVAALYPILYHITNNVLKISFLAGAWDELLLIFCIMVWVYKWVSDRKEKAYKWTPMEFPFILMFLVGIFLLFMNSPDFKLGMDGLRAVIEYMLFFFVIVQLLKSETAARKVLYTLMFSGAYMGLVGVFQYIFRVETPTNWMDKVELKSAPRVFSIIGNPNALGTLLVLLIPIAVALILSENSPFKKIAFSLCAATMTACLIFTGSRSSWIGFGIAMAIYAFLNKNKKLIVGLVLVALLAYLFVPSVQNRIGYMLNPEFITSSLRDGRYSRWPKAFELFRENLMYGVGLGRFGGAVAAINKIPGTFYIDNYYLKIAVEMGLWGITAFLILLYNALAWSVRALKTAGSSYNKSIIQSCFSGMCGVLITNLGLNNFDAPSVTTYFWIVAGVAIYLGYANSKSRYLLKS